VYKYSFKKMFLQFLTIKKNIFSLLFAVYVFLEVCYVFFFFSVLAHIVCKCLLFCVCVCVIYIKFLYIVNQNDDYPTTIHF